MSKTLREIDAAIDAAQELSLESIAWVTETYPELCILPIVLPSEAELRQQYLRQFPWLEDKSLADDNHIHDDAPRDSIETRVQHITSLTRTATRLLELVFYKYPKTVGCHISPSTYKDRPINFISALINLEGNDQLAENIAKQVFLGIVLHELGHAVHAYELAKTEKKSDKAESELLAESFADCALRNFGMRVFNSNINFVSSSYESCFDYCYFLISPDVSRAYWAERQKKGKNLSAKEIFDAITPIVESAETKEKIAAWNECAPKIRQLLAQGLPLEFIIAYLIPDQGPQGKLRDLLWDHKESEIMKTLSLLSHDDGYGLYYNPFDDSDQNHRAIKMEYLRLGHYLLQNGYAALFEDVIKHQEFRLSCGNPLGYCTEGLKAMKSAFHDSNSPKPPLSRDPSLVNDYCAAFLDIGPNFKMLAHDAQFYLFRLENPDFTNRSKEIKQYALPESVTQAQINIPSTDPSFGFFHRSCGGKELFDYGKLARLFDICSARYAETTTLYARIDRLLRFRG